MYFISHSQLETIELGKRLGAKLKGGEVIGLIGDLGSGKTALAKGIALGLGVKTIVNSPTFVLMKVYRVKKNKIKHLVHIDAYRIKSANDIVAIGAGDYLKANDAVVIVEWAEVIKKILPKNTIFIKLVAQEENRKIIIA